ncbi:MAG: lysoplasmalogenase [Acidimicrobiia bacterium]|nr:lysoplasmalogenase [Acidimicrobiia bacterium]
MTGAASLLLVLALAAAMADWVAVQRSWVPLEYLAKPLTMVLLIAAALTLDPTSAVARAWFVAALVSCLVGDVFLMVPRDLFVYGLAAFLLGHVGYIVGLHVEGVELRRFLGGILLVVVALAVIGPILLRGIRAGPDPALAGPVVAYIAVISAMVASAIGVGNPMAIGGALLFYASDALIAWNRFLKETPYARLTVMITYHLAQFGLVISLV